MMKTTKRNLEPKTAARVKLTATTLLAVARAVVFPGCATDKNPPEVEVSKSGVVCPKCHTVMLGPSLRAPSGVADRRHS